MTIETGLSDCHKMTVAVLKRYIKKKEPRIIKYRCYKNYNEGIFKLDLLNYLEMLEAEVLNKHASLKQNTIRGNQSPLMTNKLSRV